MTKISMIGKLPSEVPADEWKDRGKELPKKPFYPYTDLTAGQFRLALIEEQLKILAGYYPEERSKLEPAIQKIENALYQGIHRVGFLNTGNSEVDRLVNREIQKARKMTAPAGGAKAAKVRGIGIEPGTNSFDAVYDDGGGAAPETPISEQDLRAYADIPDCLALLRERNKTSKIFNPKKWAELDARKEDCYQREKLVKLLNNMLEKSSHHMIYNFAPKDVTRKYSKVATKQIFHSFAVTGFANISGIQRNDMANWISNGIMRYNAVAGTQPYQPEETVTIFKDYFSKHQEISGIGEPITATVATITAIISALGAAASAVATIVSQIRQQDLARLGDNITDPNFKMEEEDFLKLVDEATQSSTPSWLLPVGIAAGAGLILWGISSTSK